MQQQTVIKISGRVTIHQTRIKNETCVFQVQQNSHECVQVKMCYLKNQRNASSELFPKKPHAKSETSDNSTEVSIIMHLSKSR
jgi:hypothetical protein